MVKVTNHCIQYPILQKLVNILDLTQIKMKPLYSLYVQFQSINCYLSQIIAVISITNSDEIFQYFRMWVHKAYPRQLYSWLSGLFIRHPSLDVTCQDGGMFCFDSKSP